MANKTSKRDAMYDAFKSIRKPMAPPTKIFKSREDSEKYPFCWYDEMENEGCSGV